MAQFQCSMQKKKESLSKSEATNDARSEAQQIVDY